MNNLEKIWEDCREILKTEMTSVSYRTYVEDIKPLKLENNTLFIELDNDTQYNLISMKYKPVIEDALNKVTGNPVSLELIMEGGGYYADDGGNEVSYANGVNKNYTFDNFVVGDNNRLAFNAALAVAEMPGMNHNPLFIYSSPGLGKTHLMHAIGNFVIDTRGDTKVLYTTCENFVNEFITSLQMKKNMQDFRDKYRHCNLLLIDDIQFLTNKKETQEEFFHTFNALKDNNSQIVISSDRIPREIRDLEERLYSRFSQGLMADISAPELETRIAILKNKMEQENMYIPDDVVEYIANVIKTNIRELEGSLQRIKAFSKLKNCPIDITLVKETFKGLYDNNKKSVITPEKIKTAVCNYMNITMEDLEGIKRSRNIVIPRQIAQYLIRSLTNLSYPLIAEQFSVRDHTTIMHNCDKIEQEIKTDEQISTTVKDLVSIINR